MNDIVTILDQVGPDKKVVVLVVDGGPDWSAKSLTVLLFLSRLSRQRKLEVLCMTLYGPGQSAFNPIEHLWAPLSKKLACVSLPATLPGEKQPPSKQSGISSEERATR
ncbi:hypothetical protein HOLleu_27035 [Holothuria leucospilota]|uniref:Uncharacterized protein n=1 Tax=Holothuria leucospilota TaxID=206669 RepID=A0A9Q1BQ13_HOLLE|nr:hypothetical protein HOLleu_27035 [Holothuria leucospilota]